MAIRAFPNQNNTFYNKLEMVQVDTSFVYYKPNTLSFTNVNIQLHHDILINIRLN